MKEKGPLKHGKNHIEEDQHGDERKHDLCKHAEIHLKNVLKN